MHWDPQNPPPVIETVVQVETADCYNEQFFCCGRIVVMCSLNNSTRDSSFTIWHDANCLVDTHGTCEKCEYESEDEFNESGLYVYECTGSPCGGACFLEKELEE
jgi:hypothetical protein